MRETSTLEFKEELSDSFLKTVSAFANYGTGRIIFGVDDAGKTVGIKDLTATCLRIEHKINDAVIPAPRFTIEPDERRGTIALTVYEGLFKPYSYRGKAYKRNDTSTLPVDRLEYSRLILEGQNLTYDQVRAQDQELQFEVLGKKMHHVLGLNELNDDVMRTLGLKTPEMAYTNAAALLADVNSFKGVDVVKFGESINEIQDRRSIGNVSVISQLEGAVQIYEQYYCSERIKGTTRELIERLPREAYREALANAIVHRIWDVAASITIGMHPDKIEITSPGGLPSGLSEGDYLGGSVSVPRNPVLANVFFRLKYIEQFGTGVARIVAAYHGAEVQPTFEIRPNSIKVVLPVVDAVLPLTADERAIYDAMASGIVLSRSEISESIGFSKDKTIRLLKKLEAKGAIKKTGSGRSTRYLR